MKLFVHSTVLALAVLVAAPRARAQSVLDPSFAIERIYRGNGMISIEFGPSGRLYVAEKIGRILIFEPDRNGGFRAPAVLADLSANISFEQESGLLGMVADPDFLNTRLLYLLYTTATEQRIVSIQLNESFNHMVDGSETPILEGLPRMVPFHKGGDLQFHPNEPDNLYVSLGEDGVADWSQDPGRYNGKILRISKYDGFGLADNPFYNGDPTSIESRVYALGFRNPFRIVFDPSIEDAVYVSEDGINTDRYSWVKKGSNGNWSDDHSGFLAPTDPNFRILGTTDPFLCGIAIAHGGAFADPDAPDSDVLYISNPQEMGARGTIRRYRLTGPELDTAIPVAADNGAPFIVAPAYDMAFGPDGALYMSQTTAGDSQGLYFLHRVRHVSGSPPIAQFITDPHPASGEIPLSVSFRDASSDFDGRIAAWAWDFGDGMTSADQHSTHTYARPGEYRASLTVTDNTGLTHTAATSIRAVLTTTLSISGQIYDARVHPAIPLASAAELAVYAGSATVTVSIVAGGVIDVDLPVTIDRSEVIIAARATGMIEMKVAVAPVVDFYLSDAAIFGRVRDTRGNPARVDLAVAGDTKSSDALGYYYLPVNGAPGAQFDVDIAGGLNYVSARFSATLDAERSAEKDVLVGLRAGGVSCDDLSSITTSTAIDYATQIQPIWDGACTGCHEAGSDTSGGLDLKTDSYRHLVHAASLEVPGLSLVEPGDPALSFLFEKINCASPQTGTRMRPLDHLPPAQQALIRAWIEEGALERPLSPAAEADAGLSYSDASAAPVLAPIAENDGCGCNGSHTRDPATLWMMIALLASVTRRPRQTVDAWLARARRRTTRS